MIALAFWALAIAGQAQSPPATATPPAAIVRGVVLDARTKAPIVDAQVALVDLNRTVRTAADGRFELRDVPAGAHTLTVSTVGYIFVRRELQVAQAPIDLTLPLSEGTGAYQESVTVTAESTPPPAVGVSSQMMAGSAALQELRGVTTDDPMRAMQALPGVATGDDFQAEFSVRGAAFRHLGVVIDGTPATVLLHAVQARENTGSVAMINTDVLDTASLFSGTHPRRHGDWLGATLDFAIRDGSRDRTAFRVAVSGTSASAVVEGPIGPDKRGSWLVSIRKSYLDWLVRKLEPGIDSTIGFWDGQIRGVYDLTSRQQLQVTVVGGDATYRETEAGLPNGLYEATSGSTLGSVAWRYVRDRAITTQRVSFLGSQFDNRGAINQQLARGYTQTIVARTDVTVPLQRGWALDLGIRGEWSELNRILADFANAPGGSVRLRAVRDESARWTVASAWAETGRRTATGGLTAGVRLSRRSGGADFVAAPWVLVERRLGDAWTVRGGAGHAAQFLDPTLSTIDHTVDPERARYVDVSLEHRLGRTIRWQLTAFDRHESDVLRRMGEDRVNPDTGRRVPAATFPTFRASLDGAARGADILLMRRAPSGLTGWVSYSWSETRYRDVITGEVFDGDFDQRHTLNVFAQQRLSYRLMVSAKYRLGSNFPFVGYFTRQGDTLYLGTERNRVRLPRYARLDLRATRTFTFDRRRLTLFVEIMNALGRENVGQADGAIRANLEAVGYAERLIPFVPSAGFLIEF
jgi:hypothetical protein